VLNIYAGANIYARALARLSESRLFGR
jgi:hypothetical protein